MYVNAMSELPTRSKLSPKNELTDCDINTLTERVRKQATNNIQALSE